MSNPCLNCRENSPENCKECGAKPKNKCGAITEVYSRVSGYHRPIKNWNPGKREEFGDRKVFKV